MIELEFTVFQAVWYFIVLFLALKITQYGGVLYGRGQNWQWPTLTGVGMMMFLVLSVGVNAIEHHSKKQKRAEVLDGYISVIIPDNAPPGPCTVALTTTPETLEHLKALGIYEWADACRKATAPPQCPIDKNCG